MKQHEKYLEALKTFDDFITIKEWSIKFVELYPDKTKNEDDSVKMRKIEKSISSLVSTGKWSNMLLINKSTKPKKIKFITDEQKVDNIQQDIHLSKSPKDVKSMNFKHLMESLDNLVDDYDLPYRDDPAYIKIEKIDAFEYSSCIMLEMAHRNDVVIDIINKIEYVQDLMREPIIKLRTEIYGFFNNSLVGSKNNSNENIQKEQSALINQINKSIESTKLLLRNIELKEPTVEDLLNNPTIKPNDEKLIQIMTLDYFSSKSSFLQNEYSYLLNLTQDNFEKEVEFFEDSDRVKKLFQNKKILDENIQYLYKLSAIMESLQNKLASGFDIYPNKYYKGLDTPCSNNIKKFDLQTRHPRIQKVLKSLQPTIESAIQEFRKIKQSDMKKVADLFFMYDYNKKRKNNKDTTYITQDIKFELTKYHGIKLDGIDGRLTYDKCTEQYEKFVDLKANFNIGEKSITDKIRMMEDFIDSRAYRYLTFQ